MTSTRRAITSALLVVLLASILASASQAKNFTTEGNIYPATISAGQIGTMLLAVNGRSLTCATVTATGTLAAASTTLTVTPVYQVCHTIVLGTTWPVTVTTNGCTFTLHETTAKITLACPAGKNLDIHEYESDAKHTEGNSTCTYHLPPQVISPGVSYDNTNTGGASATVDLTLNGASVIVERTSGSSFICGTEKATGTITGVVGIAAQSGGGAVGLHLG